MKYVLRIESHSKSSSIDAKIQKFRGGVLEFEEKNSKGSLNIEPESEKQKWVEKIAKLKNG